MNDRSHIADDLSRLEAIADFINVACVALSSLKDDDLSATVTPKMWEGLGILVSEMEEKLRFWSLETR